MHIGNLPPEVVAQLTLDERIAVEDVWNNIKSGNVKKAQKKIENLARDNPLYSVSFGYIFYLQNDLATAEEFFQSALSEKPAMTLVRLGLAQIFLDTGRDDQAFRQIREILKNDPDNIWAQSKYSELKKIKTEEALTQGKTYRDQGLFKESESSYLKALFYSPQSLEAHLALADLYKRENQIQNAFFHLKTAVTMQPEDVKILHSYGTLLWEAQDYKKCLEIYEKLQSLDPGNKEIQGRIETLKNRLGIFELPSQYEAIPFSEAISKEELSALISMKFQDYLDVSSKKPPIIVDISTSWASKFILKLTTLGILDVYPNHAFLPKKITTRAELTETLFRLQQHLEKKGFKFIQQIPPERISIADVTPDNFFYKPILHTLSYDLMNLFPDKTFRPDMPVSGQEAIKILDIILALIR